MRILFPLLVLLLFISCSRSYSGLTIPAGNEFVLGEYMSTRYRATITNRGSVPVTLSLVDRQNGRAVQSVQIPPGARERLTVPPEREVRMLNSASQDAELWVELSRGVSGMRYQSPEAQSDAAARPSGPRSDRHRSVIAPGDCYAIGRGEWMRNTARVHAAGAPLHLRTLDYTGQQRIMSFGIGAGSTQTVSLDLGEWLCLCNDSNRPVRAQVKLNNKVVAGPFNPVDS